MSSGMDRQNLDIYVHGLRYTDRIKTKSSQTETEFTSKITQTKLSGEQKSDEEVWVSRVDPTKTIKEEKNDNEAPQQ